MSGETSGPCQTSLGRRPIGRCAIVALAAAFALLNNIAAMAQDEDIPGVSRPFLEIPPELLVKKASTQAPASNKDQPSPELEVFGRSFGKNAPKSSEKASNDVLDLVFPSLPELDVHASVNAAMRSGDYDAAIEQLTRFLESRPGSLGPQDEMPVLHEKGRVRESCRGRRSVDLGPPGCQHKLEAIRECFVTVNSCPLRRPAPYSDDGACPDA